jgi:PKD repeat protein
MGMGFTKEWEPVNKDVRTAPAPASRYLSHSAVIFTTLLIFLLMPTSSKSQESAGAFVTLRWIASGDDGPYGQASAYDIRVAPEQIRLDNWEYATPVDGEPLPGPAGSVDSLTIDGLIPGSTYYVALRVGDECDNWSGVSPNAVLNMPLTGLDAEFTADPLLGQAPLTVNFTALSTGEPTAYRWDFGDGAVSDLPAPQHTYAEAGLYDVTLVVRNALGWYKRTKQGYVQASRADSSGGTPLLPYSETTIQGSTEGSFTSIYALDKRYERLEESESGGKPSLRTSELEHQWLFDVSPSSALSFYVWAYRPTNVENDDFLFEYAVDGGIWRSLALVNSDAPSRYSAHLPSDVNGTVAIRVVDTDRRSSHRLLDCIYVDQLYIERDGAKVAPDTVFISAIDVGQDGGPAKKFRALATVTVVTTGDIPASGVEVFGHFEGLVIESASGTTGSDGSVTFTSKPLWYPEGDWTFAVDSLRAYGKVYSSGYNVTDFAQGHFTAGDLPTSPELYQNFPNPFNPRTTIAFWLSAPARVRLDIYNLLGQRVQVLLDDDYPAGSHSVAWDASGYASGIYFYRLEADDFQDTRKLILIK